jgi:hypothetical protein
MWRWDGQRWVPAAQMPPAPPPRRSRTWLWWVAGGCGVLLVLGIAGGIYGMVSLVRVFQSGALACLPSDFPQYPGAKLTREYTYVGTNVAPGDSHECDETFDSDDDVATVTHFYSSELNSGDWTVTSNDRANGKIAFARVSRPQTVGQALLLGRGQHTTIAVKLYS